MACLSARMAHCRPPRESTRPREGLTGAQDSGIAQEMGSSVESPGPHSVTGFLHSRRTGDSRGSETGFSPAFRTRSARRRWGASLLAILILCACRSSAKPDSAPDSGTSGIEAARSIDGGGGVQRSERYELLGRLGSSQVNHDGWVLDLGTALAVASRDYGVTAPNPAAIVERAGSTYEKVTAPRATYQFWLDEEQRGVSVKLKLYGAGARGVTAFVDQARVGATRITPDEVQLVRVTSSETVLSAGRHELMLHFWDRPKDRVEAGFAELDWLQVEDGVVDASGTYEAPTVHSAIVDRELGGIPKRSLALMAPASVRYLIRPAADTQLAVSLAYWGSGGGTAEIRILSGSEPPVTLRQQRLSGGTAEWLPLMIDLRPFASKVVELELRALDSSPGGRVLFGEPALVRGGSEPLASPRVDLVVLVVASGLDRRRVPPYTKIGMLGALGTLARDGATFDGYRVSTTVPAGVLASILTVLSPRLHGLQDQAARLPTGIKTIADVVKEAAGRTAFFTGVPTSFSAFGFNQGWDQYEEFSPVHDLAATEPLSRATRWLEAHVAERDQPKLLVVHARGAHPPWDLPKSISSDLPPKDYSGPIDPRRGGITIGKIRGRERERQRRLDPPDWERLHALGDAALVPQVSAIGRLLDVVGRADAWSRTLFVFVGDVAVGDPPSLPYHPAGSLTEDRLLTPLIVRFPQGQFAGKSVSTPVTSADIGATIVRVLGLLPPTASTAVDLYAAAANVDSLAGRALVATLGPDYATRLGPWLLRGKLGSKPLLCRVDVDPACTTDRFDSESHVSPSLWQLTHDELMLALEPTSGAREREPASIDPETAAALTVWGDIQ